MKHILIQKKDLGDGKLVSLDGWTVLAWTSLVSISWVLFRKHFLLIVLIIQWKMNSWRHSIWYCFALHSISRLNAVSCKGILLYLCTSVLFMTQALCSLSHMLYMTNIIDFSLNPSSLHCPLQEPRWWRWWLLTRTTPPQTTLHCATTLSGSHQTIPHQTCSTLMQKEATLSLPSPLCYLTER